MSWTIAAYFQNGDFANADTLLNAVADQSLTVQGKDIRTRDGADFLLAEYLQTVAATKNYALVQTPSLRVLANQDVSIWGGAAVPVTDQAIQFHPTDPRQLDIDESLNFLVNSDDAGAQDHYAVIWLGDGPIAPIDGKVFTVRCTAAIQQVAGLWVNGALTFSQKLPIANYDVVGMRVQSVTGVAGRLIFPDSPFRPGVLNYANNTGVDLQRFRYGQMGTWGKFNFNQPPQLEMLAGTAAAQVVYLDLIRS